MIFDCFLFFNEFEVLDIRLHELQDTVDMFVIVEATHTFQGKPKPLYFSEQKKQFADFHHMITHVVLEDMPNTQDPWINEIHQRDAIMRGLDQAEPGDYILMSDVDEIPRATLVQECEELGFPQENVILGFCQRMFYHTLDWLIPNLWVGTRLVRRSLLDTVTPNAARGHYHEHVVVIDNGGWHFSFLAPEGERVERAQHKLQAFSHTEYATEVYLDPVFLADCIHNGRKLQDPNMSTSQFERVSIDSTYPSYIQENLSYFQPYLRFPENASLSWRDVPEHS